MLLILIQLNISENIEINNKNTYQESTRLYYIRCFNKKDSTKKINLIDYFSTIETNVQLKTDGIIFTDKENYKSFFNHITNKFKNWHYISKDKLSTLKAYIDYDKIENCIKLYYQYFIDKGIDVFNENIIAQITIFKEGYMNRDMNKILTNYSKKDKTATSFKLLKDDPGYEFISKIGEGRPWDNEILKNIHFYKHLINFEFYGQEKIEKHFETKLLTIIACSTSKLISFFYEGDEKYIMLRTMAPDVYKVFDMIINNIYYEKNETFDVNKEVFFLIEETAYESNLYLNKENLDVNEINNLYNLTLCYIDEFLQGLVTTKKQTSKITAYCIIFDKILIIFKNDRYGKKLIVLDYPIGYYFPLRYLSEKQIKAAIEEKKKETGK